MKPIHLRNIPWPMEIFDHPQFIASIAKWYRPETFIEYGLSSCVATRVVAPHCKRYIGVDPVYHENMNTISNLEYYKMTTREFKTTFLDKFRQAGNLIEMAFIDADHASASAFQDFEDLFEVLMEDGIIFIHDTYPCIEQCVSPTFCNDSWRVPAMIRKKYGNVCEIFTIPIQPGLTMVKKILNTPPDHMKESDNIGLITDCSKDVTCTAFIHKADCEVLTRL